jgi:ornithine cyclodeaminase/alanine dehydrogenase-like protein (mu-crystallin family)
MQLTVLSDADVRSLLHALTKEDVLSMQATLGDALHYYSAGDDTENGCSASQQPSRIQLTNKDGTTTLFMPGCSDQSIGVKVLTVGESRPRINSIQSSLSSFSMTSSTDIPPFPVSSRDSGLGTESLSSDVSSTISKDSITTPSGTLTLMDTSGRAKAFINAAELTAFRTALASTMIFSRRQNVHDVVIFGAGKQAYWHARLALLLRGPDIHHLNIINRSFDNGIELLKTLFKSPWPTEFPKPKTEVITPSHTEYDRHLKNLIRSASILFCTTPATTPLFPAEILTNTEGRKKGRYIALIGSYKPHMCEIHPDIIRQAVQPSHNHHHYHKHAQTGGAIIVDSVEACLREAGELIQAGIGGREVVELGELIMLKKDDERRKHESQDWDEGIQVQSGLRTSKSSKDNGKDGGLKDWLHRGNVIYKSVGMALMVRLFTSGKEYN